MPRQSIKTAACWICLMASGLLASLFFATPLVAQDDASPTPDSTVASQTEATPELVTTTYSAVTQTLSTGQVISVTLTPSPTPTPTPTPRPTAIPSDYFATQVSSLLLSAPQALQASALTTVEKDRLHQTSLTFLADTEPDSIDVARDLQFLANDGHPSNMCGPLAAALLQEAGLLSVQADLHRFWLLNPAQDFYLLDEVFPRTNYDWLRDERPINEIDYSQFPLFPGDFIYLYAGGRGTFEHVITVTRVDEVGRAFTVTNVNLSPNGYYIIIEKMLYDPTNPGDGLFYEWTDRVNSATGITGFGGLQVWRPRANYATSQLGEDQLARNVSYLQNNQGGHWHLLVQQLGHEPALSQAVDSVIPAASTIKVPLAMLFFYALDRQGVTDYNRFLYANGADGRTFAQLLEAMLAHSDEAATDTLLRWVTYRINPQTILRRWGAPDTNLNPRLTTAADLTTLYEGLYTSRLVSPAARQFILHHMKVQGGADGTRLGRIHADLPGATIYNQQGSLGDYPRLVADTAIIRYNRKTYIAIVIGRETADVWADYSELETAVNGTADFLASWLGSQ